MPAAGVARPITRQVETPHGFRASQREAASAGGISSGPEASVRYHR